MWRKILTVEFWRHGPPTHPTDDHSRHPSISTSASGLPSSSMAFSCSTILILLSVAAVSHIEAFSPASFSSRSVAQYVQEHQRFQPVASSLDNDDVEDEIPADDYIVNVGDLEGEDDEDVGIEDDGEPPAWAASQERMDALRAEHRLHDKDTGSPEYQVAGMTERISYLTKHLQQHPKDFSTRRGLVALVNKRRRLLNYLSREDVARYKSLIASLGIRHKAPGLVASREEKYGRFPPQKAVKKHLLSKRK